MRHTHDLQDRFGRHTSPTPHHLVANAATPASANGASAPADDVDVDPDIDMDVDMDIQIEDSLPPPPPVTDAVRDDRRAWSGVPKVAAPPPGPACPLRDRRRSYRHRVVVPVELNVGTGPATAASAATTRMLSFGGAFIESSLRPAFATRVSLVFRVPGHELTIHATGTVRWSDERGFGVQFDGLRAQAVGALGKYFASL
jgi:hypothetical protein